jgi:hypothetical protein
LKYDHLDPNSDSVVVCRQHLGKAGFCISCNCFYGGVESFEFENRFVCDECLDIWRQEFRHKYDDCYEENNEQDNYDEIYDLEF